MCTVNTQSEFLNSESSTVRFAMKLPRHNGHCCNNDSNGNATSGIGHVAYHGDVVHNLPSHNNMRRSQSASSAAKISRTSSLSMKHYSNNHIYNKINKSRSHCHSQEVPSNKELYQITQVLPIPNNSNKCLGRSSQGSSLSGSMDKSDLTRMYDHATWNMYERIVNARRTKLRQLDSSTNHANRTEGRVHSGGGVNKMASLAPTTRASAGENEATRTGGDASKHSMAGDAVTGQTQKNPSRDEVTIDETDKSSASSSRSDSESPWFGLGMSPLEGGNEDHFIFQLDM